MKQNRQHRAAPSEAATHRSWNMSQVGQKDTAPELLVRRIVHHMGYRYRLHAKDLPGKPDLVFRKRKKIIFVHGCFWHGHSEQSCKRGKPPKSRLEYWEPKLARNVERDKRNQAALGSLGWKTMVVWQCELRDRDLVSAKLKSFLDDI
ncbi:DNA mismatch endonuclease Vsr [Mesorhizobium sp. B2-4-4]|nr:very short patch repair endonuclease [Mesorhizobium sp. B2-4-4]TPL56898.1 DNA mismatch endonuclease Vsr [Mesorhizobium sp. B2-4-4]